MPSGFQGFAFDDMGRLIDLAVSGCDQNILFIVSNVSDIREQLSEYTNEHHLSPGSICPGFSTMIKGLFVQNKANCTPKVQHQQTQLSCNCVQSFFSEKKENKRNLSLQSWHHLYLVC